MIWILLRAIFLKNHSNYKYSNNAKKKKVCAKNRTNCISGNVVNTNRVQWPSSSR